MGRPMVYVCRLSEISMKLYQILRILSGLTPDIWWLYSSGNVESGRRLVLGPDGATTTFRSFVDQGMSQEDL